MSKFVFGGDDKTRKRAKRVTGMSQLIEGVFPSIGMSRHLFSGVQCFLCSLHCCRRSCAGNEQGCLVCQRGNCQG